MSGSAGLALLFWFQSDFGKPVRVDEMDGATFVPFSCLTLICAGIITCLLWLFDYARMDLGLERGREQK